MVPLVTSAYVSGVTRMLLRTNATLATLSLSVLLCNVCGTSVLLYLHCDNCTMQQFMWQADLVGVAHFVRECFAMLDAQV